MNWVDVGRFLIFFVIGLGPYVDIPFDSCSALYLTREFLKMKMAEKELKTGFVTRLGFDIYIYVLHLFQSI